MEDGKPSRTAIGSAVYRAAHQVLDAEPKILDDPVSIGLVPGSSREEILARADHFASLKGFRESFVTRSRVAEDHLHDAVAAGIAQYVILGAGLDTFAYRQPAWAKSLEIFEVDHPATQGWKRKQLRDRDISVPANIAYVPCNFEGMTLKDALLAAGTFKSGQRAFFSWLGVVMYLTRDAIEATFRDVLALPSGTLIIFGATVPIDSLEESAREAMQAAAKRAEAAGEPMITFLPIDEWKRWLAALGFSRITHITPEQTFARYFAGRTDGLRAGGHYLLCEV